jgi:hypothetical protein
MMQQEFKTVKKVIHGQEVEVKVYPIGASNYVDEDDLEALIEELGKRPEPTVQKTGIEHYLKKED